MKTVSPRILIFLAAGALLPACASKESRHLNYAAYPKLPMTPVSRCMRATAESIPCLERRTLYGNYGGPGNEGGRPIDAMDDLFRQHDIAYNDGVSFREIREADLRLDTGLRGMEGRLSDPVAEEFRRRAIRYLDSWFGYFWKPRKMYLGIKRRRAGKIESPAKSARS